MGRYKILFDEEQLDDGEYVGMSYDISDVKEYDAWQEAKDRVEELKTYLVPISNIRIIDKEEDM